MSAPVKKDPGGTGYAPANLLFGIPTNAKTQPVAHPFGPGCSFGLSSNNRAKSTAQTGSGLFGRSGSQLLDFEEDTPRAASAAPNSMFGAAAQQPSRSLLFGDANPSSSGPGSGSKVSMPTTMPTTTVLPSYGLFASPQLNLTAPTAASPSGENSVTPAQKDENKDNKEVGMFSLEYMLDLGTNVTTVRVGTEPKHADFTVHENLLKRSPFFTNLFSRPIANAAFIAIDDHEPTTFRVYVNWLYSGRLSVKPAYEVARPSAACTREDWNELIKVYILGNFLGDVDFCDLVMDDIVTKCVDIGFKYKLFGCRNALEAYTKLASGHPLRELFTDIVAYNFAPRGIENLKWRCMNSEMPAEFAFDVMVKVSKRLEAVLKNAPAPLLSPITMGKGNCDYHCHGDKKCYKL